MLVEPPREKPPSLPCGLFLPLLAEEFLSWSGANYCCHGYYMPAHSTTDKVQSCVTLYGDVMWGGIWEGFEGSTHP